MKWIALLLSFAFASACTKQEPVAAPAVAHPAAITWFAGTVKAALAEAQAKNKPVFLFWHAAWCPYCQDLKASVFTRQDVIAKMDFFIPVSLDGDLPGAQKI